MLGCGTEREPCGGSASAGDDAANTTDEVAIEIADGPVGAGMALGTEFSSETPVGTRGPNATAGSDGRSTRFSSGMRRSSRSFRTSRTIAEQITEEQKTLSALQVRVSKDRKKKPPELFHVDSSRTKNNPTPTRAHTHPVRPQDFNSADQKRDAIRDLASSNEVFTNTASVIAGSHSLPSASSTAQLLSTSRRRTT